MSSTLETSFEASKQAANKELQARAVELSAEETNIADARIRFEAERLLDFYEELTDSSTRSIVPVMVQNFLRHEDECSRTTSEALRLACLHANENADITQCNALLGRIDALRQEADDLEVSILSIVDADTSEACAKENCSVSPSLRGLLSVIHENGVNLIYARSLVQCSKDSLRIALRNWNTELLA
ncbi:uncharacterized protein LAESUDRAFT_655664 [Laetiporus sulphureus 93-53]|uniref:Uncharacterized protein n=1 Tax=Laetiporus sulphureus 93-53 TaxID=1314785 RepID=A0A165DSN9_9APHY|nr:uncharacterized protein LAESUDRAFT_655664 [Laetiporus sulphureus 93-53]KZT05550.1 hypothetical protein LAESUDRAFT_655664 [Laetiporus sulphureus 93-53]